MRIGTFFYTLGQGIKNLFRNKGYTAASIATISACLFLFGLFYSVLNNVQHILHEAEQSVSVTVFFNEGTSTDQIDQLKIALEERPEVRQIDFVSADQAWEQFSQDFLGDYVDGFTDNPLEDMANLEIYLNDVSKQADLVDYLDNIDIVRKVNRSDITASTLTAGNNLIYYATMAIIGILFVVSIFLISNTVATGITSHKDEINIMKYIGATDFFVRAPYVFEGVIIGIIGSLIPLGLTYFIYNRVILLIQNRFSVIAKLVTFVPVESVFRYLAPIIIVLGVGIGFIGSAMTIRKHLHV
jgi:cell division transport system permease protein